MFRKGEFTGSEFPCEILTDIPGGNMAELFLAKLQNTEHLFVVKAVDATASALKKEELYREAMVLKQLRHEQIPEFYGYFEESDKHYFIMSYHAGTNLEQFVKMQSGVPEKLVWHLVSDICRPLAYLHEKKIVYGDLKPSNLLVKPDGCIVLLDFGTAEHVDQKRPALFFHGTFGYAAPECWHRDTKENGIQTDIFALGALMYYLLEGKEPKEHFGKFSLSDRQKKNRWQPVLDKCCALNMRNRYQNAAQVFDVVRKIKL